MSGVFASAEEGLGGELVVVGARAPDQTSFVHTLRCLELPCLDAAPFLEAPLFAAAKAPLLSGVGASAQWCGPALRAPPLPGLWGRTFARWTSAVRFPGRSELGRAEREGWRAGQALLRRWGAVPPEARHWGPLARVVDDLLSPRFAPPAGWERFPRDLEGPPLRFPDALDRRRALEMQLPLLGRDLWRLDRLASAGGARVIAPFLSPDVQALARAVSGPQLLGNDDLHVVRSGLFRAGGWARRRRVGAIAAPHPTWPFGPGTETWVARALAPDRLEELGLFAPDRVAAVLERSRSGAMDAVRLLEARALRGVLGVQLLAESLGLSGVDWPR